MTSAEGSREASSERTPVSMFTKDRDQTQRDNLLWYRERERERERRALTRAKAHTTRGEAVI
jgi:hypothetical protein